MTCMIISLSETEIDFGPTRTTSPYLSCIAFTFLNLDHPLLLYLDFCDTTKTLRENVGDNYRVPRGIS